MKKLGLFALLLGFTSAANAAATIGADLFSQGRNRASIYGGTGFAFDHNYFVLGMGLGRFVLPGLQVGVDGEAWLGNDPGIYKVTPQILYVVYQAPKVKPYFGGFYRYTVYEEVDDLSSYGGRAGLIAPLGPRTYAGAGFVYEQYMDCNDKIYSSCSSTYPEFVFSVVF